MNKRDKTYRKIKEQFEFDYKNSKTHVGRNFFFQLYWFSIGWLFENSKNDDDEEEI